MSNSEFFQFIFSLVIILLAGCSKSDDASEQVFIRVKNTSLLDLRDIKIVPGFKTKAKNTGPLEVGKTTDYLAFDSMENPYIFVQLTEHREIGNNLIASASGEPQKLATGKYTIEVYVPNASGEIELTLKVVKE